MTNVVKRYPIWSFFVLSVLIAIITNLFRLLDPTFGAAMFQEMASKNMKLDIVTGLSMIPKYPMADLCHPRRRNPRHPLLTIYRHVFIRRPLARRNGLARFCVAIASRTVRPPKGKHLRWFTLGCVAFAARNCAFGDGWSRRLDQVFRQADHLLPRLHRGLYYRHFPVF